MRNNCQVHTFPPIKYDRDGASEKYFFGMSRQSKFIHAISFCERYKQSRVIVSLFLDQFSMQASIAIFLFCRSDLKKISNNYSALYMYNEHTSKLFFKFRSCFCVVFSKLENSKIKKFKTDFFPLSQSWRKILLWSQKCYTSTLKGMFPLSSRFSFRFDGVRDRKHWAKRTPYRPVEKKEIFNSMSIKWVILHSLFTEWKEFWICIWKEKINFQENVSG